MADDPSGTTDPAAPTPGPDEVADEVLLQALTPRTLVFVRTDQDRSVVVEHGGRRVVVGCTDPALLRQWWASHAGPQAADPPVRDLPFRHAVALWAASDVDLLVDPSPGGAVLVPMAAAREHLGYAPVVADGDGSEPLPFMGFTGGRARLRLPLLVMVIGVVVLVLGLTRPDVRYIGAGLLALAAGYMFGRPGFGELQAAARANKRLRAARRHPPRP